jgi:hypothetical protein
MLRPRQILGLAVFLSGALLLPTHDSIAQTSHTAASPASHKSRQKSKKPVPVAEAPQVPTPPPTLEQQSPAAPQVTYNNGLLTITSTNATLSQVLRSVQMKTGATVDIPPGAGSERVVATLGPGKPQAVLASLLNGSKFNYVILGEPNNPGAVQKVILLAKSSASAGQAPDLTAQNNSRLPQQQQAVEPPDDEYQPNEPEVENQNQLVPGQPGMPGSESLTPDNINPAGRTPEQMLQELQRVQQQQQQMQQQLNPANQQPINPQQQNQQPVTPFPAQPAPQPQ